MSTQVLTTALYQVVESLQTATTGKIVNGVPMLWWPPGDPSRPNDPFYIFRGVITKSGTMINSYGPPFPQFGQTVTISNFHSSAFYIYAMECVYRDCSETGTNYCIYNAPSYYVGINIEAAPASPDFSIAQVVFPNSNQEADQKYSTAPNKPMTIVAPITATNVDPTDTRSVKVTLSWPTQQGGPLEQTIPISSLANGAVNNVQFTANFLPTDAGDQQLTVIVDPGNTDSKTQIATIHVLCDVTTMNIIIPYQPQYGSDWANDLYNNQPGNIMQDLGCMDSTLSMLFNAYGINTSPYSGPMTPGAVNKALTNLNLSSLLGPNYASYNGYTPSGLVWPNGAVNVGRAGAFIQCMGKQDNVGLCQSQSLSAVSYKGKSDTFLTTDANLVNQQICKGNPIILKVASKTAGSSHYVLATAMTVDSNGIYGYKTMDPGSSLGSGKRYFAINGYRRYSPSADPDMLFLVVNSDVSMVITDPQGKRAGFDPLLNQIYSEIVGASYLANDSIGSLATDIHTKPETQFESLQPVSGQYQVEVFATKDSSYDLVQYSYDSVGNINGISESKGTLKAGTSKKVSIQHAAQIIPMSYASLNINEADFVDKKRNDFTYLDGFISSADGSSIGSIDKYVVVQVGTVRKTVAAKSLHKHKHHGHTVYSYESWGKHGFAFEFEEGTGDFKLSIFNDDLDVAGKSPSYTTSVSIAIDNHLAVNTVIFKDVTRKCHNGK